jgi:hypothetical protein
LKGICWGGLEVRGQGNTISLDSNELLNGH